MSALTEKLLKLYKAANLYAGHRYAHYLTSDLESRFQLGIPGYLMRAVMQTDFAYRVSEARGGVYDDIVNRAIDIMLMSYETDGACTRAAAAAAEDALMPLKDISKEYTVHMVSHAHIDMNWQWPYHETVAVTLETFRTVLKLMREYPEFTYSQSQASTYNIVEKFEPDMLGEIRARVREGRWEVTASTWVEADKNMPTSESMARHLMYTKNYLSKLLDIKPESLNLDYEPDTFGHSENLPEILTRGGVKYYYFCRGRNGGGAFIWRAPSGASVLAYQEPTWYLGDVNPAFAMRVPSFCKRTGTAHFLKVYGVGDHGGGPTRQDLTYIQEMQTWPVFPMIKYSTYRAFFEALERARERLPIVDGELNCVFTGCYTTQSRIKAANRLCEATLCEAEALSAMAKLLAGRAYPARAFEEGWRRVLFSQFHDIITGSCVRETREYALGTYSEVMAYAGTEYAGAMRALAENIDSGSITERGADAHTRAEGAGVGYGSMRFRPPIAERGAALTRVYHVFNPSPYEKGGAVELEIWDYPGDLERVRARSHEGRALDLQWLKRDEPKYWGHTCARALVPASAKPFGWTTIILDDSDTDLPLTYPSDLRAHAPYEYILENEFMRAEFDVSSGMLNSLTDKRAGKEMLSAPAGFFEILEDADKGMTSWVVGRYIRREAITRDVRITKGACGAIRNSIILTTRFGAGSILTCEISLDNHARHLAYSVKCDWRERGTREGGMTQLAFAAPYAYKSERARYDVPAGAIDRAHTDMDVPANSYACAINEAGAPALCITSDSKYGMRAYRGALQMTLIRAGCDPDPDPEHGAHEFSVALAIVDDMSPPALANVCALINRPFSFVSARPHAGRLPLEGEFMRIESDSAAITQMKFSEDGESLVMRVTNYASRATARLVCALPMRKACVCSVNEERGEALKVENNACELTLNERGFHTLRIDF